MNLSGRSVLVIGGAGFIGSHVVEQLLNSAVSKIYIYDNFVKGKFSNIKNYLADKRCEVFTDGGDIRDIDVLNAAVSRVDSVVHLAAMWLLHSKEYPRTTFEVNIQGTFNVLEACVKNNIERLVFSSSASVYGDAVEIPMSENHPFNNRNFYGASKIAGEAMARAYFERYGLPYVGLRYMNVYGPLQNQTGAYSGVIPTLLNKIDANEVPEINGDGSQTYDFISVQDVARANVLALESKISDEFFNIGTGIPTTIKTLCDLILNLKKSNLNVVYKPYDTKDIRQFVQNRIGSVEKASELLGFRYKDDLESGLKSLINWRNSLNESMEI